MPRGEDDVCFGAYLHDTKHLRQYMPVVIQYRNTALLSVIANILITCIMGGSGKLQFIPQASFGVRKVRTGVLSSTISLSTMS